MDWGNIPSLASLRAFEAAVRCQNLSAAARELNVTHAAIAQHVRNLEATFGETLLQRQGRGVAPTIQGAKLAESLRNGFEIIASGVKDLQSYGLKRPLNISVTPVFANNWLMPRIGDFWAKHPEIQLNINPASNLVDLKKDGFDLGIRYGDGEWPNLTSELLTDGDFWVVAHPDLIEGRQVNCLQDVDDLPWLLESHMMERRAIVEREGLDFDNIGHTLLETNALVMSGLAAGLGVSVQPKALVEREVNTGKLAKICELDKIGLGYHIVTLPNVERNSLRIFIKWLRSVAR